MPLLTTQSAKSYGLNRYLSLAANSYEAIGTAMGTGSSGTITFSSIPQTYKHLQLRTFTNTSRSSGASGSGSLQFNGDTVGTNYWTHYMQAFGASVGSGHNNENYGTFWYGDSNTYVGSVIDILDYASTTKKTTAKIHSGYDQNGAGATGLISLFWNNTAAVNQIVLTAASYNWGSNSRFALYGIKG